MLVSLLVGSIIYCLSYYVCVYVQRANIENWLTFIYPLSTVL